MKTKGFLHQTRKRAKLNKELITPYSKPNWPICITCGREVDSAVLENWNRTSVEIRVTHHGAEDFHRVEFPFPVDGDPQDSDEVNWAIGRAMKDASFFDPTEVKK
jgi:hypothetical protein